MFSRQQVFRAQALEQYAQRQEKAILPRLVTPPMILLLDEATSALDMLTEQAVERNLKALACTQIIIAHRLSTIQHADLILVLDQGTILERGTHAELLSKQGLYARLIENQLASGTIKAGEGDDRGRRAGAPPAAVGGQRRTATEEKKGRKRDETPEANGREAPCAADTAPGGKAPGCS